MVVQYMHQALLIGILVTAVFLDARLDSKLVVRYSRHLFLMVFVKNENRLLVEVKCLLLLLLLLLEPLIVS